MVNNLNTQVNLVNYFPESFISIKVRSFNFYCFISIHLDDNLIRHLNQKVVNVIQKCTIPLIQRWKIWTTRPRFLILSSSVMVGTKKLEIRNE